MEVENRTAREIEITLQHQDSMLNFNEYENTSDLIFCPIPGLFGKHYIIPRNLSGSSHVIHII